AGSNNIVVTIKDGGKKLIQVADDGSGIEPDDLDLAISRHATSKIKTFDDLYGVNTNGFRGEALASICSIAKVSLASKTKDSDAIEILVEDGVVQEKRHCARKQGTTISVKFLFYKTPARLKFLKTAATETSHITDIITKLALVHPDIGLTLKTESRTLLDCPAQQDLIERARTLYGDDIADDLYPILAKAPGITVSGLIGHPQIGRSQRHHTLFFVNGRPVKDKVIWHAVMEAYRDLLMKGRYPVTILKVDVDPQTVDVNVHPTKAEIRFHQSQQVHHWVYHAVRNKLTEAPWLKKKEEHFLAGTKTGTDNQAIETSSFYTGASVNSASSSAQSYQDRIAGAAQSFLNQNASNQRPDFYSGKASFAQDTRSAFGHRVDDHSQRKIQFGQTIYADMNPIGQLLGTYILCEGDGRLILIDQHAAHERVGFEKLHLQFQKEGVKSESLLIPETFDLKPSDADILKNYLDDLKKFGFELEFFGGNTFVLKAVPRLLKDKLNIVKLIGQMIDDIKETGELVSLKDKVHHVLATMACHAQIRAHHHLTPEEIQVLLKELDEYQFTDFCPHGRPVSVEVTLDEIEKWFKRVL
ncbi:MAG: DNA mismatch repair endonuclease MutL, partial [Deltaproteobacteria bacterium]|nr:DNA mismatch repair endonuclease MutL [Deltaproteobacteria bacterium]